MKPLIVLDINGQIKITNDYYRSIPRNLVHNIHSDVFKMFEEDDSYYTPQISFDPLRDPNSFTFKSKVDGLGQPGLPLHEPNVRSAEATFGMG